MINLAGNLTGKHNKKYIIINYAFINSFISQLKPAQKYMISVSLLCLKEGMFATLK